MFDPVHYGHLRPALEVQHSLGLEEIRFIPVGQPPHRGTPHASAEQRVAMLRAAISDQPGFILDDREIRRNGPSYMVDTLASLRDDFVNVPLCLILGFDAFLGLCYWHQWSRLLQLAHLVVTHRPGWNHDDLTGELHALVEKNQLGIEQLNNQPAGGLCFVPVTQLDISSTVIRQQVSAGQDIRYLLPDSVNSMIKQYNLYR